MFPLLYFGIPVLVSFWVIYRFKLSVWRVLMLSFLPAFLFGVYGTVTLLFGGRLGWDALFAPIYFGAFAYLFAFPELIAASLMTISLQQKYHLNIWYSMLVGGISGMLSLYLREYIQTSNMEYFDWWSGPFAMVLGALSVAIMYYFIEIRGGKRDVQR